MLKEQLGHSHEETWNLLSWFLLVLKYWLVLLILLLISWRFESRDYI